MTIVFDEEEIAPGVRVMMRPYTGKWCTAEPRPATIVRETKTLWICEDVRGVEWRVRKNAGWSAHRVLTDDQARLAYERWSFARARRVLRKLCDEMSEVAEAANDLRAVVEAAEAVRDALEKLKGEA